MKRLHFFTAVTLAATIMLGACNNETGKTGKDSQAIKAGISKQKFGEADGKEVDLYTLTNSKGDVVKITNYGGTMTAWISGDKNGNRSSILLGFDSLSGYLAKPPYFGALIGRYGNRIAKGKFKIDGTEYAVTVNDGVNTLHGGKKGFDKVVWDAAIVNDSTPTLLLTYTAKDGEEGYPGNLKVNVRYTLTNDNEVEIEYTAETDKPTVVNLTQHNYYNLTGDGANSILDHKLLIKADAYTPVDSGLIPTGELRTVKETPFDFTTATRIGARIAQVPGGYDHNWVLNKKGTDLELVAELTDSLTGRKLEVFTQEPGLQFYSGNFLDGTFKTPAGKSINQHNGLCLETQHFPDAPNQPKFAATVLKPGEKYHTLTKYKLSAQ